MRMSLKPVVVALSLLPCTMSFAQEAQAPAKGVPTREAVSVNAAVADLMKGGAPVETHAKAAGATERAPLVKTEAPKVVAEEPLNRTPATSTKESAAATQAAPATGAADKSDKSEREPADKSGAAVTVKPGEKTDKTDKDAEVDAPAAKAPVVRKKTAAPARKATRALSWAPNKSTLGESDGARALRRTEIEVSDTDYNRFVFPVAITQIISPAGSTQLQAPLYMAGNRHALLRLNAGSARPIQIVAELEDGSVQEFYIKPAPIRGITREMGIREYKSRQSREAAAVAGASPQAAPSAADMYLLEQFASGQIPEEFEEEDRLSPEVHFERFWAKPIAAWSNGGSARVEAWRLVGRPGLAATVAAPQFYRPGVRAVLIENDIVDGKTHPLLLLVTDVEE